MRALHQQDPEFMATRSVKKTIYCVWSLTSNQEGAAAWPRLVDDITGVLAVALSSEAANGVLGLVSRVKMSGVQQTRAQPPLVTQHA